MGTAVGGRPDESPALNGADPCLVEGDPQQPAVLADEAQYPIAVSLSGGHGQQEQGDESGGDEPIATEGDCPRHRMRLSQVDGGGSSLSAAQMAEESLIWLRVRTSGRRALTGRISAGR